MESSFSVHIMESYFEYLQINFFTFGDYMIDIVPLQVGV